MLHSRCYCTWELKELWQLYCHVAKVTPTFVFRPSCEDSMIVIQGKYFVLKNLEKKDTKEGARFKNRKKMEASSWMADGKRLSKSGGSDLISDCPERNLIGMQPAPICLKFHRRRICLEFHWLHLESVREGGDEATRWRNARLSRVSDGNYLININLQVRFYSVKKLMSNSKLVLHFSHKFTNSFYFL